MLVVKRRPGAGDALRFRFPLDLEGLTAREELDGGVGLYDVGGKVVGRFPTGVAWDSAAEPSAGPVRVSLAGTAERPVLEVEPDPAWVSDLARVFPLYVDPTLDGGANPPAPGNLRPVISAGATTATVTTTTPTLAADPVVDQEGSPVSYWFRMSNTDDPERGQTVNSGWLSSPSFAAPEGSLRDGMTYSWKVAAWDGQNISWSSTTRLKVNLRLGGGPSPADEVAGLSVNLATGNVSLASGSPSISTVGGPIGVSYTYSSKASPAYGLTGRYYGACTSLDTLPAEPSMVRTDAPLDFSWGVGAPVPGVDPNNFCVVWEGLLTVPSAQNNYIFGANHDDDVRIWIGGQLVLNSTSATSTPEYGTPVSLLANQTIPVRIEHRERSGGAHFQFWAKGPFPEMIVPADWLSLSAPGMPSGWSLSADVTGDLMYNQAVVGDQSLVLVSPSGAAVEFRRPTVDASGAAWAPTDGVDDVVTATFSGGAPTEFQVHGGDGTLYIFDAKGKLRSATPGTDVSGPTAPKYIWNTTTARLDEIQDRLLPGRAVKLQYSQDEFSVSGPFCPVPAGFANPPVGALCRLTYVDGSTQLGETQLLYQNGQLARIVDPGSEVTDFGYTQVTVNGRPRLLLSKVRSPLAYDAIAAGQRANDTSTYTDIGYDSFCRVTSVTSPAPFVGDARPQRNYTYPSASETRIDVVGTPENPDRRVTFDDAGRALTDADGAGNTTTSAWDPVHDRLTSTVDPEGRRSTRFYSPQGWLTQRYGPAPAAQFDAQGRGGPLTQTAYDGATTFADGTSTSSAGAPAIRGLAATYWDNPNQAGEAKSWAMGVDSSGVLSKDWGAGAPSGVTTDTWSARFTGSIQLDAQSSYFFRVISDDGFRFFLDDQLIVDAWAASNSNWFTYNNPTPGPHRLRIDYRDTGGLASIGLWWKGAVPEGVVPGDKLAPRYGLATATKDADGKRSRTDFAKPEEGLPTATVVDPGGLALVTSTAYNDTYRRRTSRNLPKGSATTVMYSYYTPAETVSGSCAGTTVAQAGLLKRTTAADPDGAGGESPIIREQAHDAWGRMVGTRTIGHYGTADPYWACTSLDARGRTIGQSDRANNQATGCPAGRMLCVTFNGITTTTTFRDSAGTTRIVTETADLLGRLRVYKDEHDTFTRYMYDQAGRLGDTTRQFSGDVERLITHHDYDTAGRISAITEHLSGVGRTTGYGYYNNGALRTVTRPNGVVTTTSYQDQGYVSQIAHAKTSNLGTFTYGRSPAGRMTVEQAPMRTHEDSEYSASAIRNRTFSYDGAGRLTAVGDTRPGFPMTQTTYAYDPNSNRCGINTASSTTCDTNWKFDNADRITDSPGFHYGYDNHGNVTSNFSWLYAYDTFDHATQVGFEAFDTLAPSGRVLNHRFGVIDSAVGYGGPGDSPSYERSNFADNFGETAAVALPKWDQSKWDTYSTGPTRTVDVLNGAGRLEVITDDAKATALMPAKADVESTLTYWFSDRNASSEFQVHLRHNGDSGTPNYFLEIRSNSNTIKLRKVAPGSSSSVTIGQFTYNPSGSGPDLMKHGVRFRVQGNQLKVKVWPKFNTEPSTWNLQVTDTSVTAPGFLRLNHEHTSGPRRTVFVDDVVVRDLSSAEPSLFTTTYITGPGGLLAVDRQGVTTWPLANAHGDIVGTTNTTGAFDPQPFLDEWGADPQAFQYGDYQPLGWTGSQLRFTPHGNKPIIRMGARLYDPTLGRFLQTDPVESGSCNDYDYVCADPVNQLDLDGRACRLCRKAWKVARAVRNAPVSGLGALYGAAVGAKCRAREGMTLVCSNAKRGYVPRGGFMVGNVFITRQAVVGQRLLKHETRHSDQWAFFGQGFGLHYAGAEAVSLGSGARGDRAGCNNLFERAAGLKDGGYRC
ncbi:MAG: PA14 domain-containing protein [Acidimicrobiia bacterium]